MDKRGTKDKELRENRVREVRRIEEEKQERYRSRVKA
jgi:hypothetical protein